MIYEFNLPQDNEKLNDLPTSLEKIGFELRNFQKRTNYPVKYSYTFQNNEFLHVKCIYNNCCAKIVYKKLLETEKQKPKVSGKGKKKRKVEEKKIDKEVLFILVKYSNRHTHSEEQSLEQIENVDQIIKKVESFAQMGVNLSACFAENNLGYPKSLFHKALYLMNIKLYNNWKEIIFTLKKEKHYYYQYPDNDESVEYPQIFVGISESMKKKFQSYGKCLHIYIKSFENKMIGSMAYIITFFGLNCVKQLVVFGFGILKDKNKGTVYKAIQAFFDSQKRSPQTIIVYENYSQDKKQLSSIRAALKKMNEKKIINSNVLSDRNQLLQEEGMVFDNEQKKRILLKVSQCQNLMDYRTQIGEKFLPMLNKEELKCYQQTIEKHKNDFFFCLIPSTFVICPKVEDTKGKIDGFLKKQFFQKQSYFQIILTMFQQIIKQNQKSIKIIRPEQQIIHEKYFNFVGIQHCRKYLNAEIFQFVQEQIGRSRKNLISFNKNSEGSSYLLRKLNEEQVSIVDHQTYKCTCGFYQKTEIPCDHSLSIMLMRSADIFDNIGNFYKRQMLEFDKITYAEDQILIKKKDETYS